MGKWLNNFCFIDQGNKAKGNKAIPTITHLLNTKYNFTYFSRKALSYCYYMPSNLLDI